MANTIWIKVDDVLTVLDSFDQIQVHRSTESTGPFSEITTPGTRIDLDSQDNLYNFEDLSGDADSWYKTQYYNSSTTASGVFSDAFKAEALDQLLENMEVSILVDKSVKNISGDSLSEDEELYFTTLYNPLYSSVKKLKLDIGSFITGVPDDTINLAIFEASLEADALTFVTKKAELKNPLYLHARRQWTSCRAAEILLNNLIGGAGGLVRSKRLADFSVEYDTLGVENMLNKARLCQEKWEPQLNSAGRATQEATMVVKGERDPDKPPAGRGWTRAAPFNRIPIGNTKVRFRNRRRWTKSGRLPRMKFWWEDS